MKKAKPNRGCPRPWAAALPVTSTYDEVAIASAITSGAEPTSPDEYLNRVRYEACRLPNVVTIQARSTDDSAVATASDPRKHSLPVLITDDAWEAAVVKDFVALRNILAAWQLRAEQEGPRAIPCAESAAASPPSPRDASAWAVYTRGGRTIALTSARQPAAKRARPKRRGDPLRYVDIEDMPSSDEEDDEGEYSDEAERSNGSEGDASTAMVSSSTARSESGRSPTTTTTSKVLDGPTLASPASIVGSPPWLRTLLGFDQVSTCRALRQLVALAQHRFNSCVNDVADGAWAAPLPASRVQSVADVVATAATSAGESHSAGSSLPGILTVADAAWLYAFLARLERPLVADTAALVRQLYSLVRQQRALLEMPGTRATASSDIVASLDVLRAVAGRYFEQRLTGE